MTERRTRHLFNGDAALERFGNTLDPHASCAWFELLFEGPVSIDLRVPSARTRRARWLEQTYGISPEPYMERLQRVEAWLDSCTEADELVLWFEDDHFCEVNLLYVCARLAAPIFSRIDIALVMAPGPWGLAASKLDPLDTLAKRKPLRRAELGRAAAAWRAYCGADPRALLSIPLPRFLPDFLERWRGRFPDGRGLDRLEAAVLESLDDDGPCSAAALFGRVCSTDSAPLRPYGIGDLQFWRLLHGLADRDMVALEGGALLPMASAASPPEVIVRRTGPSKEAPERLRPGRSRAPVGGAAPSCWSRDDLN